MDNPIGVIRWKVSYSVYFDCCSKGIRVALDSMLLSYGSWQRGCWIHCPRCGRLTRLHQSFYEPVSGHEALAFLATAAKEQP